MKLLQALALISYIAACFGQNDLSVDIIVQDGQQNVVLECNLGAANEDYVWIFEKASALSTEIRIFDSSDTDPDPADIVDGYLENLDDSVSQLTIQTIRITDDGTDGAETTGRYRCQHGTTPTEEGPAHVIAIAGGGPSCVREFNPVGLGSEVDLTCSVTFQSHADITGATDPTFTWQKDGSAITEGANDDHVSPTFTNVLTQTAVESTFTNEFDCNIAYVGTTSAAPLSCSISVTEGTTDVPVAGNVFAKEGELNQNVFTCTRADVTYTLELYFQPYNDVDEPTTPFFRVGGSEAPIPAPTGWVVTSDADNVEYTLAIDTVTSETTTSPTAGSYRCVVTDPNETPTPVEGEVQVVAYDGPTCRADFEIALNSPVSLTCEVSSTLRPTSPRPWTFAWENTAGGLGAGEVEDSDETEPLQTSTSTLEVEAGEVDFGTPYTCKVTSTIDGIADDECSTTISLVLEEVGPDSDLAIADGDAEELRQLTCDKGPSAAAEDDIIWEFSTDGTAYGPIVPHPTDETRWTVATVGTVSTLTIEEFEDTAGLYRCTLDDDSSTVTVIGDPVEVIVVEPPECVPDLVSGEVNIEPNSIEFVCTATILEQRTDRAPTQTWTRESGEDPPTATGGTPDYTSTLTYTTTEADVFDDEHICTVQYVTENNNAEPRSCSGMVPRVVLPVEPIIVADSSASTDVFTCRRNEDTETLRIIFTPFNDEDSDVTIFEPGDPAIAGYTVTDVGGVGLEYTLTIDEVTMVGNQITAGNYRCEVGDGPLTGEVPVVAVAPPTCSSDPAVGTTETLSDSTFKCSVLYSDVSVKDNLQLTFTWNDGNEDVEGAVDDDEDVGDQPSRGSELTVPNTYVFGNEYDCSVTSTYPGLTFQPTDSCQSELIEMISLDPVISEDDSGPNNQFVCTRSAAAERMRFYFKPYNGVEGPAPVFDTEEEIRPDPATSPWSVTPAEYDELEYTLTINPVTMDLDGTATVTAGTYSCEVGDGANSVSGSVDIVAVASATCSAVPSIATTDSFDEATFTCSVQYSDLDVKNDLGLTFAWNDESGSPIEDTQDADNDDGEPPSRGLSVDVPGDYELDTTYACIVTSTSGLTFGSPSCQTQVGAVTLPSLDYVVAQDAAGQTIPCARSSATDSLSWTFLVHTAAEGAEAVTIYNTEDGLADGMEDTYSVTETPAETRDLTIDSISADTAGTYTCTVTAGEESLAEMAEVFVVASTAAGCALSESFAAPDEDVDLTCTVTRVSHQDLQPIIRWEVDEDGDGTYEPLDTPVTVTSEGGVYVGTISQQTSDIVTNSYRCVAQHDDDLELGSCDQAGDALTSLAGLEAPDHVIVQENSADANMQMMECGLSDDDGANVQWLFTPFNADPDDENAEVTLEMSDEGPWNSNPLSDDTPGVWELHIFPVVARPVEGAPVTAGTYRCVISPTGIGEDDTPPSRTAIAATYNSVCNSDEDDRSFTCDVWSSEDLEGTPTIDFLRGDNVVDEDTVTGPEPVAPTEEVVTWQSVYSPAVDVDGVDGVDHTCRASTTVDGNAITTDTGCGSIGGSTRVKVSILALFVAVMLSALHIY